MAKFFELFSTNNTRVEQDKGFYKGFVMGLAFERFEFASQQAAEYADLLEKGQPLKKEWIDSFIACYGDLYDESDEELKQLFQTTDTQAHIERFREAEADYSRFFREQVATRLGRIEEAFQEAQQRTNLEVNHKLVKDLRELIETPKTVNTELASVLRTIKQPVFSNAYLGFMKKTYGPTEFMVVSEGGREADAEQVWTKSMLELQKKIKKRPHESGFYRWYDRSADKPRGEPALMSSFFMNIARFRWKDITVRFVANTEVSAGFLDRAFSEDDSDLDKVRSVINLLGEPCASIIWYHHIEKMSLEEVAEKLGLSYGYVRNLHPKCVERLRDLLETLKID